jgi:hypothetical protein
MTNIDVLASTLVTLFRYRTNNGRLIDEERSCFLLRAVEIGEDIKVET